MEGTVEREAGVRDRLFGARRVRVQWVLLPAMLVALFVAMWGLLASPETAVLTAAYLAIVVLQFRRPSVAGWAFTLAPWAAYGVASVYWHYWIREHLRVPIDLVDVTNGIAFGVAGLVAVSQPWPRDRKDALLELAAAVGATAACLSLFLWSAFRGAL